MSWNNLKSSDMCLTKVDDFDIRSISLLYENSCRIGNESNNNVQIATAHPDVYFDYIIDDLFKYVSYITRSPSFDVIKDENSKFLANNYHCDSGIVNSIHDLKLFLKENGEFSTLALFSIVKFVDLNLLTSYFSIRYKKIEDIGKIRNSKIEYITNGTDNN